MKNILWSIMAICYLTASSQRPKASRYELAWAMGHPFAAVKVKQISKACRPLYDSISKLSLLDRYQNGGKTDAFRHSFYMACFAQKIKAKKLRKLGVAHEKFNHRQFTKHQNENDERADSLGSVMDLYNNDLGFEIGRSNKILSQTEIRQLVLNAITSGKALVMKRDQNGNYLTCEGGVIDMHLYESKWYVPKCLVSSQ